MATAARTTIKTNVTFPISKKAPYSHEYVPSTTDGAVLADTKAYFGVQDDTQCRYVLTHDGVRLDNPDETLEELARKAHALEFRLVKEITQG